MIPPLIHVKIEMKEVHHNLVLDQLVKEQLVLCKFRYLLSLSCFSRKLKFFRNYGCQAQIPLVNKKSHESSCAFGPSKCPWFIRGCKFQGCLELPLAVHQTSDSSISGSKDALENHLKVCAFELLQVTICRLIFFVIE